MVSNFVHFRMLYQGIFFCELLLVLLFVIKVTLVVFGISVLIAEDVFAFAWESKQANFSFARPAQTFINLWKNLLDHFLFISNLTYTGFSTVNGTSDSSFIRTSYLFSSVIVFYEMLLTWLRG